MNFVFIKNNKFWKTLRNSRGVTFIELIVVISIFAIISSIVLFNFSDFSTSIEIQNLSHDIALSIKKTQTDSISGYRAGDYGIASDYRPSYGVHFGKTSMGLPPGIDYNHVFYSFIDKDAGIGDGNKIYDDGNGCGSAPNTECISENVIDKGGSILSICINSGPSAICSSDLSNVTLDIVFRRPFPDAVITSSFPVSSINDAQIVVVSPKGNQKIININKIGQISVQ